MNRRPRLLLSRVPYLRAGTGFLPRLTRPYAHYHPEPFPGRPLGGASMGEWIDAGDLSVESDLHAGLIGGIASQPRTRSCWVQLQTWCSTRQIVTRLARRGAFLWPPATALNLSGLHRGLTC
jgi:hypothetical protein